MSSPGAPAGGALAKEASRPPRGTPLDWRSEAFYEAGALDRELERVFDICHGCRRCFSLCNAFPTLFDAVDATDAGEVTALDRKVFWDVVDNCYLCDMCFMTKCPYVPPHPWNVDFPHLMLRAKAARVRSRGLGWRDRVLAATDTVGALRASPWWSKRSTPSMPRAPGAGCSKRFSASIAARHCPPITRAPHAAASRRSAPCATRLRVRRRPRRGAAPRPTRKRVGRPRRTPPPRAAARTRAARSSCSPPATAIATSPSSPKTWSRCSSTTASRLRCSARSTVAVCHDSSSVISRASRG